MTRTLIALRPEPGLAATIAAGAAMGLRIVGHPLFEVRACEWECPDPASVDALLIGSANAIRHGGAGLNALRDKPVHAVGEATAQAARAAGLQVASLGAGGLQNVLDQIARPARLLRLAGEEHVALLVPEGVSIETRILYHTAPLDLPDSLAEVAEGGLIALLHSAAAAHRFGEETQRLGLARSRITLALIGPRLVDAAGAGWQSVHVSPTPSDHALLEMVREMCI